MAMASRHPEMYRLKLSSHQTDGPLKRLHQITSQCRTSLIDVQTRHISCDDVTPVITRSSPYFRITGLLLGCFKSNDFSIPSFYHFPSFKYFGAFRLLI